MAKIAVSEAVIYSYRANDGLFSTLVEVTPVEKQPEIEYYQKITYEKGLQVLAQTVNSDLYAAQRKMAEESIVDGITLAELGTKARIMVEFDTMQRTLRAERVDLSNRKETVEIIFLSLYALGALFLIAAGMVRLWELRKPIPGKVTLKPSIERTCTGKPGGVSHVKR